MLRISKMADYGTIVLTHMAQRPDELHNARSLAEHTQLTVATVSKLLKSMLNKGLLVSQRGAKGGYSLAREAREITVADIVTALDGNFGLTECSHHPGQCSMETSCDMRTNWRLISEAVLNALKKH